MRVSTVSTYCTATLRAISAAAGDFNLSKSEIAELQAEPTLSLSETAEPTVSLSDTEFGFSLLVAIRSIIILKFMPALCSLRKTTYYARNYARIIASSLLYSHFLDTLIFHRVLNDSDTHISC